MNEAAILQKRHAIRKYSKEVIDQDTIRKLRQMIEACNKESGLHIRMYLQEPKAFQSFFTHFGRFSNVENYIALIGKPGEKLEENCGYYGEKIVCQAIALGLDTCWVAGSFQRKHIPIHDDEQLCCVIAIGYGKESGKPHKSKPIEELCVAETKMPSWFLDGMRCVQIAPTAMNKQQFQFTLHQDHCVSVKALSGKYSKIDLGIVKYHFEAGAGQAAWKWKN